METVNNLDSDGVAHVSCLIWVYIVCTALAYCVGMCFMLVMASFNTVRQEDGQQSEFGWNGFISPVLSWSTLFALLLIVTCRYCTLDVWTRGSVI